MFRTPTSKRDNTQKLWSTLLSLARKKSTLHAGVTLIVLLVLLHNVIRMYHVQIDDSALVEEEEESCFRPRRKNTAVARSPLSGPCEFKEMIDIHPLLLRRIIISPLIGTSYAHRIISFLTLLILSALVINLGMPKMGSTSIHSYFRCGGYTSVHWICGPNRTFCGNCIEESIKAGLPPLSKCPTVDSYAQIDKGPENMPQVNYLEEIVSGIPNATFIMTFRNMTKWYISLSNWLGIAGKNKANNMKVRFQRENITGLPPGVGRNVSEFSNFYCEYVKRVRKTIAKYPGHQLVEIDIEDPTEGWQLEEVFGVNRSCWGKTNIHVSNDTVSMDELHR
jgi:hypothetical protein